MRGFRAASPGWSSQQEAYAPALLAQDVADVSSLQRNQLTDARVGEVEQSVERLASERHRFRRSLQLDVPPRASTACARPPTPPQYASRSVRVVSARGSTPYSSGTDPSPELRRNCGTRSSTLAVQMTCVLPDSTRTDPSAWMR